MTLLCVRNRPVLRTVAYTSFPNQTAVFLMDGCAPRLDTSADRSKTDLSRPKPLNKHSY